MLSNFTANCYGFTTECCKLYFSSIWCRNLKMVGKHRSKQLMLFFFFVVL